MRRLVHLCLASCVGLSATAAFARGGMGAHMSSGIMGNSAPMTAHITEEPRRARGASLHEAE